MAYTPVVTGDLASNIVTAYANAPLPPLAPVLQMGSLINRFYEGTIAPVGQTVNVPLPTTGLTVNDMGEAGTVTQQVGSNGTVAITVNQHKEVTFTIPDVTSTYTNFDIALPYIQAAYIAMATKVETDLLGLYTGLTANTAVGAAVTAITPATLISARQALVNSYVPSYLPKYLVMSPAAYAGVMGNTAFTSVQQIGDSQGSAAITGNIGQRFGVGLIEHQLVKVTGSGGTLASQNICFAPDFATLITRALPVSDAPGVVRRLINFGNFVMRLSWSYQAANLAPQWTVDCLYGFSILRNNFGVVVNS